MFSAQDLYSHSIRRQSLWTKLTTVSIATAFTQINSISRNGFMHCIKKTLITNTNSSTPSAIMSKKTSEPKTWFEAYLISSLNNIGKHGVREGWLVVDMHVGEVPRTKFKMSITPRSRLASANNSPYHQCGIPFMNSRALSPRRVADT